MFNGVIGIDNKISKNNNNYGKKKSLPHKTFQIRNSLLTDLFENPHIRSIYNLFLATFVGLFLNNLVGNYVRNGTVNFGFTIISYAFDKIYVTIVTWLVYFGAACFWYYLFQFWIKVRFLLIQKIRIILDIIYVILYFTYFGFSSLLAIFIVHFYRLPPGSAAIVILENIRLNVKIYAFIRSNFFKVIKQEEEQEQPEFSKYLYFLFAPTLIYQDSYPRSKKIRWLFVIEKFTEIICVIFYYSFLVERYFLPAYQNFGIRKFTWGEIILTLFENSIAGALILLTSFYMILHCWLNLFAELLKFGDRLFYKDWWNSNTAFDFFYKWNLVVNNFFYTYLYKDLYEFIGPMNKQTAKFIVFVLSAIAHEVILWLTLQFCLPVLLLEYILFGLVISCCAVCKKWVIPKFLFWYGVAFGIGHIFCLYAMEMCLRINDTRPMSLMDVLVPRLFNTSNYIQ